MNLKYLDEDQQDFVCFHFAEGKRVREFLPSFREHFPDLGQGVDEKHLKRLLSDRFRKLRGSQRERINAFRAILEAGVITEKGFSDPERAGAFLMSMLQKIWWDTPRIQLVRGRRDKNGAFYEIYDSHTKSLVKILKKARETSIYSQMDIIPITRQSYRLRCLQRLSEQTPLILLQKVKHDDSKPYRIYQSQGKDHLAIFAEARTEVECSHETGVAITSPFYRLKCLEKLWNETFRVWSHNMSVDTKNKEEKSHTFHVKILLKILEVAALETRILEKNGWTATAKDLERIPMAFDDFRSHIALDLLDRLDGENNTSSEQITEIPTLKFDATA